MELNIIDYLIDIISQLTLRHHILWIRRSHIRRSQRLPYKMHNDGHKSQKIGYNYIVKIHFFTCN